MNYKYLANTNLKIPEIGLGTWNYNGGVQPLRAGIKQGANLVDTAEGYHTEDIVGEAVKNINDEVIIATKVSGRNLAYDDVLRSAEQSLVKLGKDKIDLYQIHWPDPLVPVEETAAVLRDLYDEDVIRAIGVSNFSPAQMDTFQETAPLHTNQPPYNLFERAIEDDVLPYCQQHDVKLITYSALCRGLLTGKMTSDYTFDEDDHRSSVDPKFQPPRFAQYVDAVNRLDRFAQKNYGKRVIHLAARWILDQGVDVALWGARTPDQLDAAEAIDGWTIDAEAKAEIDRILDDAIDNPVAPEFMTPSTRETVA